MTVLILSDSFDCLDLHLDVRIESSFHYDLPALPMLSLLTVNKFTKSNQFNILYTDWRGYIYLHKV